MNPFRRKPTDYWPEALSLLADGEQAYRLRRKLGMLGDLNWMVVDRTNDSAKQREVPAMIRAWVVATYCNVFVEWLLSGPEPFEQMLAKYRSVGDWAEHETLGKFHLPDETGKMRVASATYKEFAFACLGPTYLAAIGGRDATDDGDPIEIANADETEVAVLAQLFGFASSLTPQQAWDGLGTAAQEEARAGAEVRNKRVAYAYTREHFAEWIGTTPTGLQALALVERLQALAPTMTMDECEAMATHGVDLGICVPEDVWLQIRAVLDDEFEVRLVGGLFATLSPN